MTSLPISSSAPDEDLGARLAQLAMRRETGVFLFLLAVLQQCLGHHNADNAWLFTVSERLLDGARIYSDIIETNPPASFLIYVPATALARLLHLPLEFTASVLVFAAAAGSLFMALAIARRGNLLTPAEAAILGNAGILALVIIPGICFAQREHIALIAIVPVLCVYACRSRDAPVALSQALGAGVLAAVAIAIKPYFALAMALPFLILVMQRRSVRSGFDPENMAAAAAVALYGVSVFVFFPGFFEILPALLDTYIKVKMPLRALLTDAGFTAGLVMIGTTIAVLRVRGFNPVPAMLAAGALGFTLAALIQGKGWLNHFLPGLALGLLALVAAVTPHLAALAGRGEEAASGSSGTLVSRTAIALAAVASLLLPMIMGGPHQFAMSEEYPGLRSAVLRHAPPQPKVMAISVGLDVAFPLVRQVEGRWTGRTNILWLMGYSRLLLDRGEGVRAKLRANIDHDAAMFAADVQRSQPDIILSGPGKHVEKIWQHPAIAAAMATYKKVETASGVSIYVPVAKAANKKPAA